MQRMESKHHACDAIKKNRLPVGDLFYQINLTGSYINKLRGIFFNLPV